MAAALPVRSCLRDSGIPRLFEDDEPVGAIVASLAALGREKTQSPSSWGARMPSLWAHCVDASHLALLPDAIVASADALRAHILFKKSQVAEAEAFLSYLLAPGGSEQLRYRVQALQGELDFSQG